MFNKILVVYNEKLSEKHLSSVERVKAILHGRNFSLAKSHNLKGDFFDGVDLVVTIGGDGTFIRAASFVEDALILGINSEPECSEGALTSIKEEEILFLDDALDGKFHVEERIRIQTKLNAKILDKLALNEVYVGTASQFHTSRYIVKFKGREEEQRSSGVLITTGLGSNAWYRSAGGQPFGKNEKKLAFIIREPYFGRVFRPSILKGEILAGEKIVLKSNNGRGGMIALDSNYTYDLSKGSIVEIELSSKPLRVMIR